MFFLIQNLQILIICMDNQEFLTNLDYVLFFIFYNIVKVNYFSYRFIILLHLISSLSLTKSLLVPYAYVTLSNHLVSFFSPSFELIAILLIFPVKTLYLSLLNLYCIFNIDLLFSINSLWFSLTLSISIVFCST